MASTVLQLFLSASYLFANPPAGPAHCESFVLPSGLSSAGVSVLGRGYHDRNDTLAFSSGNGELNQRNEVPFCREPASCQSSRLSC